MSKERELLERALMLLDYSRKESDTLEMEILAFIDEPEPAITEGAMRTNIKSTRKSLPPPPPPPPYLVIREGIEIVKPEVKREALSLTEIAKEYQYANEHEFWWFIRGTRFAEKHHGIIGGEDE